MKEACGVVGIVAPGRSASHLCYDALYALQHRGQESAGMATFNNHQITVVKDNGLVSHVFAETTLRALAAQTMRCSKRSCAPHSGRLSGSTRRIVRHMHRMRPTTGKRR